MLAATGLPTLFNQRLQDLPFECSRLRITYIGPQYIANLFKRQQSNHNLRNADFILPRFNTVTNGKHSVKYLGPKLWARIPNNIKSFSLKTVKKIH